MSALCRAPCCATTSRVTFADSVRCASTLALCRPATSSWSSASAGAPTKGGRPVPFQAGGGVSVSGESRLRVGAAVGAGTIAATQTRALSLLAHRPPLPFFSPLPGISKNGERDRDRDRGNNHGKAGPPSPEEEVDDGEWEMRVARAMLHLRESLPLLFTDTTSKDLFPDDIYSKNVVLRLQHPFPLKVSSLHGYTVAFNIARNGMQALHTDLNASLERMTFSAAPAASSPQSAVREALLGRAPTHRQKQIRVLLTVTGKPRLPPHKEATWHTSSLYTFSPYSGLIASHEVETIRPLPGEGVGEWLMKSLLGWTGRAGDTEGAIPCPRAVEVEVDREHVVRSRKRDE